MPPRDTVLLVTHSGDHFTVERVAAALARRGAHPFRLDTDLFPSETHLTARLDALMSRLGLVYGALDLIRTPDGRHVFLEVNPSGEFFWLERRPGLPISGALADVLLGLAPRRGPSA